jgi:multicomponent Na+:H+ antiporter subunit D
VLVAIGVGGPAGFAAAILYSVVNALNKILLFLTVEMRGAIVGAVFALGALSVAGIPPAVGFVGKLELFRAAVDDPAVLALFFLGSALSFVYVFQIYQFDFWRGERSGKLSRWSQQSLVAFVALVVLALGLWPEPLLALSHDAAQALGRAAQ